MSVYEGAHLTPILRLGIIIAMAAGDQYFTLKAQKVTFVEQAPQWEEMTDCWGPMLREK